MLLELSVDHRVSRVARAFVEAVPPQVLLHGDHALQQPADVPPLERLYDHRRSVPQFLCRRLALLLLRRAALFLRHLGRLTLLHLVLLAELRRHLHGRLLAARRGRGR